MTGFMERKKETSNLEKQDYLLIYGLLTSLRVAAPFLWPQISTWRDFNQSRGSCILGGSLWKSDKAYGPL